jgi:molybdenum cofactor synthesis domain-containing protein
MEHGMEYRLLRKTEIRISPVELAGADLGACAEAAARALRLNPEDIMVTDVLEDTITLDVLAPTVRAEQIVARNKILLKALASVPGVGISSETEVHSDGILGLIELDEEAGREVLKRSNIIGAEIAERIRKRSVVFATGQEVLNRQIRDTNTPYLMEALRAEGYHVREGSILEDRVDTIAGAFRRAAGEGYGLAITTGGIGAEGKDRTLEALKRVDPQASTPYVLKFQKGRGRHQKDGVRIGVGVLEQTLIVCLPGPHDEIKLVWATLKEGLKAGWDKKTLADASANALRQKFLDRGRPHSAGVENESA